MTDRKTEFRRTLRERLLWTIDRLDEAAPDFIIANAVDLMYWTTFAHTPEFMGQNLVRRMTADTRQRVGLCNTCGERSIPTELTHPPDCQVCSVRIDAELDQIDAELRDDPEAAE